MSQEDHETLARRKAARFATAVKYLRAYAQEMKAEGRCLQCQRPWYDGICDCDSQHTPAERQEANKIATLGVLLETAGVKIF